MIVAAKEGTSLVAGRGPRAPRNNHCRAADTAIIINSDSSGSSADVGRTGEEMAVAARWPFDVSQSTQIPPDGRTDDRLGPVAVGPSTRIHGWTDGRTHLGAA